MRKLVLLFLALSITFSLSMTVYAAETKATTITVTHETTLSEGTISTKKAFDSIVPKNKVQEMFNSMLNIKNLLKVRKDVTDYQIVVPSTAKTAGISSGGYAIKTAIWENSYYKTTGILWWKKSILVKEKHALLILGKDAIYQKFVSNDNTSFSSFSKILTIK